MKELRAIYKCRNCDQVLIIKSQIDPSDWTEEELKNYRPNECDVLPNHVCEPFGGIPTGDYGILELAGFRVVDVAKRPEPKEEKDES